MTHEQLASATPVLLAQRMLALAERLESSRPSADVPHDAGEARQIAVALWTCIAVECEADSSVKGKIIARKKPGAKDAQEQRQEIV